MKIEIKHIPSEGLDLVYHKPAAEFIILRELMARGECGPFTQLDIELNVRLEGDLIVAAGVFTTAVELTCSRCVESFIHPMRRRFTLRFSRTIPLELGGTDEEVELTAEQVGLIYFPGETLDLKTAIEEQVVMGIPFKPLCSEACKGLCPRCGANLNLGGECDCGPAEVSSPFAVLRKLNLPPQ